MANYTHLEYSYPLNADFYYGLSNPIPAIDKLKIYSGYAYSDYESPLSSSSSFLTSVQKWLRLHQNQKHSQKTAKSSNIRQSKVKLQTFLTSPKSTIYYFYVMVSKDKDNDKKEYNRSSANTKRPNHQLVKDIIEQQTYKKSQQEELQKVLANSALKHKTTNQLKRIR